MTDITTRLLSMSEAMYFDRGQDELDALLLEAKEEIERLREGLTEAEETLRLVEHPAFPDPIYHHQVKDLGNSIGFGALMSTASAAWREILAEKGYPIGSEFVAGPCHGTVVATLAKIRAALIPQQKGNADGKQ